VGAISALAAGIFLQITDKQMTFDTALLLFNIGTGMMFSVLSQMGFFAYLTLNYIVRGTFLKKRLWTVLQWILLAVAFVDAIYLRYVLFAEDGAGLLDYAVLPLILLAAAFAVSYCKVKMTNASAFTPTMFFMFVFTLIEAVPALRLNNPSSTVLMVFPLAACNAWQILLLHKFVKQG
jgi:KinB signaling pathway activation protein